MQIVKFKDEGEDEPETIVTYLELINDFIKANLQHEMNQVQEIKTQD